MLKSFSHSCRSPKALHIYPTEPIVSLMKRQDLIKTFQTLFACWCSAEAAARWAHLTPRQPEAGSLLVPLEGEPTNQSNAFSGGPRSMFPRFNRRLRFPPLPPATLVVKNSLGCCLYYLLKDVVLEGQQRGKRRLYAGARRGFTPPTSPAFDACGDGDTITWSERLGCVTTHCDPTRHSGAAAFGELLQCTQAATCSVHLVYSLQLSGEEKKTPGAHWKILLTPAVHVSTTAAVYSHSDSSLYFSTSKVNFKSPILTWQQLISVSLSICLRV